MTRRKAMVILVLGAAFLFVVPIIPTSGNPLQLAGFFPRYASATCVVFHAGVAYGPNSFLGMRWFLSPVCGL